MGCVSIQLITYIPSYVLLAVVRFDRIFHMTREQRVGSERDSFVAVFFLCFFPTTRALERVPVGSVDVSSLRVRVVRSSRDRPSAFRLRVGHGMNGRLDAEDWRRERIVERT